MSEAGKISEALRVLSERCHICSCDETYKCIHCLAAHALPLAEKLEGKLAMAEAALHKAGQHAKNMQEERDSLRAELEQAKAKPGFATGLSYGRNEMKSAVADLRAQVEQLKREISECEQILNPGPIERGGDLKQMVQFAIQSIDTLQGWRRELQKEIEQLKADKERLDRLEGLRAPHISQISDPPQWQIFNDGKVYRGWFLREAIDAMKESQ